MESDNEKKLTSETATTTTASSFRHLSRNPSIGVSGQNLLFNTSGQLGQQTSTNQLLNIFNYTGILYTQTDKKYIQLKLKDFYSNNNSILLTGKIPS